MNALKTRSLAAVDPALPALGVLFDPPRLSALLGRPVRADRLRHKPGVSVVARLREDDGGIRWLTAYAPGKGVKVEKTLRRAAVTGVVLEAIPLPEAPGQSMVSGPIELDPRLYKTLRPLRNSGILEECSVLNYNPHRRVVFAVGQDHTRTVCKTGSAHRADAELLERLVAGGVPVLTQANPAGLPELGQLRYFPWFGSGDLSKQPADRPGTARTDAPAFAAGQALALLHAQPPVSSTPGLHAPAAALAHHVARNSSLLPPLAGRLEILSAALEPLLRRPGHAGLIHGDFSADQVLVDGSDIRLTDLDRCTYGAAASDLGCFAAVELLQKPVSTQVQDVLALPLTRLMLAGYRAGPRDVEREEVLPWVVFHLLSRLGDPFRSCSPNWSEDIEARLDLMEGLLWG
ncbi:aminoglycoside phosphotransferase family protein [Arthrobacter sp. H41]|uniref:aminoglycoside phosphotransferase family protein n=1 Tax=Arthrobacter sp. H41 TaxID=1312978 RepID=UPI000478F68A|nr:aminoglycoside phosphotransferase family protein [Arthrobacter sp. H41]